MTELFKELLQLAVGARDEFSVIPDANALDALFYEATREGMIAGVYPAIDSFYRRHPAGESAWEQGVNIKWLSIALKAEKKNTLLKEKSAKATEIFSSMGMRSCILKGQAMALYYPDPKMRDWGDIDIWVEGGRENVLKALKGRCKTGHPTIHHVETNLVKGFITEVHYLPAWLYNRECDKKLQEYFSTNADAQFSNMTENGFAVPTDEFNLVFCAVHCYKHTLAGEPTLKQVLDYYFILRHCDKNTREKAYSILENIGLGPFCGHLMFLMKDLFLLDDENLLCPVNSNWKPGLKERTDRFLWRCGHRLWRDWKGYI